MQSSVELVRHSISMQDASRILLGELQIFMQEEEHIAASCAKRSAQISLVAMGREQGESWQKEDERLRVSFSLFGLLRQQNLR